MITRRLFFKQLAIASAFYSLPCWAKNKILPTKPRILFGWENNFDKKSGSLLLDLGTHQSLNILHDFIPHSLPHYQSSIGKLIMVAMPKYGQNAFVHKEGDKKTPYMFTSHHPDYDLYGHGQFSSDGKFFFTIEQLRDLSGDNRDRAYGKLVKRRTMDFKVVDSYETGGYSPHEVIVYDSNHLILANGGIDSNLVILRMSDGKIIKNQKIGDDRIGVRHLTRIGDKEFIGVPRSLADKGRGFCYPVIFNHKGVKPLVMPSTFRDLNKGQILNVNFVKETNSFYTCCPSKGCLLRWDATSLKVQAADTKSSIKAMAYLPHLKKLAATNTLGTEFLLLDPLSLAVSDIHTFTDKKLVGAHMYSIF